MVGHFGHEDLGLDAGNRGGAGPDRFGARVEVAPLGGVILGEIELQRGEHADHLFLVHLHAASDRVAVGRRVQARGGNQVFAADEQAGALRAAQPLAPGKGHQIEPHLRVLPQVLDRRDVGGGVVHRRYAVLPSQRGELFVLDPSLLVVVVVEQHHCGLRTDGALQILARLDLDELHAAVADRMVVTEPMRFLNDDFALHAGQVRQVDNLLAIGPGQHGGRSQRQGGGGAGGYHGRLAVHQGRNPLPDLVVQLVEHDVVF